MTTESITYKNDTWYTGRVAVVVATFGDEAYETAGDEAVAKLEGQTVRPIVVRAHSPWGTLAEVRNSAAMSVKSEVEWLVFLDSDDELDYRFVEELHAYDGPGDILQTAVRGFQDIPRDRSTFYPTYEYVPLEYTRHWLDPFPVLHKQKFPLTRQNYLIIGSPIQRDLFEEVGGFDEWPVLEDWALWLKCFKHGAIFDELGEAIYYINDDHNRNNSRDADDIARQIRATY